MSDRRFEFALKDSLNKYIDDEFKIFMHQEFYKFMLPYIPFRTGCLSSTLTEYEYPVNEPYTVGDEYVTNLAFNSGNITESGIQFNSDYAEKCYYTTGIFNQIFHPLATSYWGDLAFNSHKDELENILTEYLERKKIDV